VSAVVLSRLGAEGGPLLVFDGLQGGEALRREAAGAAWGRIGPHFPGIRAKAPDGYAWAVARMLTPAWREVTGTGQGELRPTLSVFSIVTTRPEDLTPMQRVPHFDGTEEAGVASIHYLCEAEVGGGTAFFRHRTTSFERVTADRHEAYDAALRAEVAQGGLPARYVGEDDPYFERIGLVECRPDRLTAYSGTQLHSGAIPKGSAFEAEPGRGRLTVNTFLRWVAG
jgi:hypothetical protein